MIGRKKGVPELEKKRKINPGKICKWSSDCEKCPLNDCKAQDAHLLNRHQFYYSVDDILDL